MFCPKCGNQLPDGAKFCGKCGAKLGAASAPNSTPSPTASGAPDVHARLRSGKGKWYVLGAAAVVVIAVVVILIVTLSGGGGSKSVDSVVSSYFKYAEQDSPRKIADLFPERIYSYYTMFDEDMDAEDFLDGFDDHMDYYGEAIDFYEVSEKEKLTGDELSDAKQGYRESYNLNLQAAYTVDVRVYYEDGAKLKMRLYIVQLEGDWYLARVM